MNPLSLWVEVGITCCVESDVHREQMALASSVVFFFTCSSCAAWMRGSMVPTAPLCCRFFPRSHSSSWLMLYLQSTQAARPISIQHIPTVSYSVVNLHDPLGNEISKPQCEFLLVPLHSCCSYNCNIICHNLV